MTAQQIYDKFVALFGRQVFDPYEIEAFYMHRYPAEETSLEWANDPERVKRVEKWIDDKCNYRGTTMNAYQLEIRKLILSYADYRAAMEKESIRLLGKMVFTEEQIRSYYCSDTVSFGLIACSQWKGSITMVEAMQKLLIEDLPRVAHDLGCDFILDPLVENANPIMRELIFSQLVRLHCPDDGITAMFNKIPTEKIPIVVAQSETSNFRGNMPPELAAVEIARLCRLSAKI